MTTVFITGGANGIGRATVDKLLDRGDEIIVFDSDGDALADLPSTVTTYQGDVADTERVEEVVEKETFDVLVHCAGFQRRGAVEDMAMETVERHFATNTFGVVQLTRAALPMLREREGRIVTVSSLAGQATGPFWGAYAASKHAVEAFSDALRLEVAEFDVDVVIVEPGPIRTGFNERGVQALRRYLPDSIYSDRYHSLLEQEFGGAAPEKAATVLITAITDSRPKPRYTVTWQAWLAPKLRMLLPERLWDRIVKQW